MNLLSLLAGLAFGHVNMPVDVQAASGVQYSLTCQSDGISGTLTSSGIFTDRRMICYAGAHDGEEVIGASFNDGMGSVACPSVPLTMYEPASHYRSPCRASFTFNTMTRTCTSACVSRPWNENGGGGLTRKPTAYPNPLRASKADAMQFMNLPAGGRARVYSMTGRLVWEGAIDASGDLHWHLEDKAGRKVATGVYIVVAENGGSVTKLKVAVQR